MHVPCDILITTCKSILLCLFQISLKVTKPSILDNKYLFSDRNFIVLFIINYFMFILQNLIDMFHMSFLGSRKKQTICGGCNRNAQGEIRLGFFGLDIIFFYL